MEKKPIYEGFIKRKEEGEVFSDKDLTPELLYEMAVTEGATDSMIGSIFELTKDQVKYRRGKIGLGNIYAKSMVEKHFEELFDLCNRDFPQISDAQKYDMIYYSFKTDCDIKGWHLDKIVNYLYEKTDEHPILKEVLIAHGHIKRDTYKVTRKELKHIATNKKSSNKSSKGKCVNQRLASNSRIEAGSLGEEIARDFEEQRLRDIGLDDKIDDIEIITKTKNKNVTYDGEGYDIVSFNEKREKIYIEVKCSTTRECDGVDFFISLKEVKFMQGNIKNIKKENAFIYYVYNINKKLHTADVIVIDSELFASFTLNPYIYQVSETFREE